MTSVILVAASAKQVELNGDTLSNLFANNPCKVPQNTIITLLWMLLLTHNNKTGNSNITTILLWPIVAIQTT